MTAGVTFIWRGDQVKEKFQKQAFAGVRAGCKIISDEIGRNVSVTGGYTGHPYSKKNPTGYMNTQYQFQVHKPGSGLVVRKPSFMIESTQVSGVAGLENTKVARMIVYGTSKMVPRDVVHESAKMVLPEVRRAVEGAYKGGGGYAGEYD